MMRMERGTVVVVDDEPNIADLVELYLEREGYLFRTEAGAYLIGPRLAQMSSRATRARPFKP